MQSLKIDLSQKEATEIISAIDLTSLEPTDTDSTIFELCARAQTPYANVAAVCIIPKLVRLAKEQLRGTGIKVATVANFPAADFDLATTLTEINTAVIDGADEIDIVMPYATLVKGESKKVQDFISECRAKCSNITMKLILETGLLSPALIKQASEIAIDAGVDFIKTSTGKTETGATLGAAKIMLQQILHSGKNTGLKVSGGIRTTEQALEYLNLAKSMMANDVNNLTFRIGASSLLSAVLNDIKDD